MDIAKLADGLHPLERKILPIIAKAPHGLIDSTQLIVASGLQEVEVSRALQWLKGKTIIDIKEEVQESIILDKNGRDYLKNKLPERRFLESLNREMSLKDIERVSHLSKEELNSCMGLLKRKNTITISKHGNDLFVSLTDIGRNLLKKDSLEELFLKKQFPLSLKDLSAEEKFAYGELLKRRNIIAVEQLKRRTISLTELGISLADIAHTQKDAIDSLSQDIIRSRAWQNKEFRSYDVSSQVPKISYGKKHFENETIEYVKSIWLHLGFREMSGPMVQTAFWDLDCLFVPQDHPAREMQDTFYLKKPSVGKIPEDLKKRVKAVHENGADTGSKGWGGVWDEEKAKKLMLRTHTTVISAETISRLKKTDLPAKFFIVGKVFRNETPDWKHLFEFYQVDGIVVDPNATFQDLKGYLQEFFNKMGYDKIKMRPAHFPYTEPSVEVEVFDRNKNQWVELGGAGMFRPEVTKTLLGFECPVLAWGLGLGRIAVPYYGLTDLRDFNKNDLKQLKSMKKMLLQQH